jgi:hypothetical protein
MQEVKSFKVLKPCVFILKKIQNTLIPLKNFHNFCFVCPFHSFHISTCMACPCGGKGVEWSGVGVERCFA